MTNQLPDSDITVLMRLDDDEYPVWPGFHDGEQWRVADGEQVTTNVTGWMHLGVAAGILDGAGGNKQKICERRSTARGSKTKG